MSLDRVCEGGEEREEGMRFSMSNPFEKKTPLMRFLCPLLHDSISRKECVKNIIDGGKSTLLRAGH